MPTPLPTPGTDPYQANSIRRSQKHLDEIVLGAFRIKRTDGKRIPRKRKKHLYRIERANYRALIVSVSRELARRDRRSAGVHRG